MYEEWTKIYPPLFLASTLIDCWRCGADMPVVALIAPNVPETEDNVCILSNIEESPAFVITFIQKRCPTFKMKKFLLQYRSKSEQDLGWVSDI